MANIEQVREQMLSRRVYDPQTEDFMYVPGDGLPEITYWVDPERKPDETPLDQWGFVDVDKLIELVKARIKPEYHWTPPTNIHHLYWPEDEYIQTQLRDPSVLSYRFREIAPNKVRLPLIFHRMIHVTTLPPPMPPPDVMESRAKAWGISQDLFTNVRNLSHWERMYRRRFTEIKRGVPSDIPTEQLDGLAHQRSDEILWRHFSGVARQIGRLSTIPQEHWPFSAELTLPMAAGEIGDIVLRQALRKTKKIRSVDIREPVAVA